MSEDATQTVRVKESTWKRLNLMKEPGDSFDDIISGALDEADRSDE